MKRWRFTQGDLVAWDKSNIPIKFGFILYIIPGTGSYYWRGFDKQQDETVDDIYLKPAWYTHYGPVANNAKRFHSKPAWHK